MKKELVRNPGDLPIIENPNKPSNTMAKKTTDQAIDQFSEHAQTALYILGGQALAAQGNAILVPMALQNQSATIQQGARAAIPLLAGVGLAMFVKNSHVRRLSLGLGTQGVLEGIKLLMPNFNPQDGLSEGSSFVFTDQNGEEKTAVLTPEGMVKTSDGKVAMLPQAKAKKGSSNGSGKKQSKRITETNAAANGELAGWGSEYVGPDMELV